MIHRVHKEYPKILIFSEILLLLSGLLQFHELDHVLSEASL